MRVRNLHPYSFRTGQWAKVLTTIESYGRPCWLVEFPDAAQDWWVIDDPAAEYEIEGATT